MSLAGLAHIAGAIVLALAACGVAYGCVAIWALAKFVRRAPLAARDHPSITVLKPLHGDEPELYENLESFCAQVGAGPIQLILGANDPSDPALAIAERLAREHADQDIVVVANPQTHGTNRKIGNLINMAVHARGEIIVISDSDVRMPANGLAQITAALAQPGVGLIHCLYRGRHTASLWSRLAAMDINTRFAPSVLVGEALGANPCLGPTMALPASVLAEIGGLPHLADFLADDFELGRAVRATGRTIACPPIVIDHVFPEKTASEVWAHELRWGRTVRLVQPAGYIGSVVTYVTPLALIGAVLAGFSSWSLAALAGLVLARQVQAIVCSRMMGAKGDPLWLVPPRDVFAFGVFLAAIVGDRVEWRGNRLRVGADGAIAAT